MNKDRRQTEFLFGSGYFRIQARLTAFLTARRIVRIRTITRPAGNGDMIGRPERRLVHDD